MAYSEEMNAQINFTPKIVMYIQQSFKMNDNNSGSPLNATGIMAEITIGEMSLHKVLSTSSLKI